MFACGTLFYLLTVSIYSHWLRPLSDAMADRFLFMPSLGLGLIILGLLAQIPFQKEQGKPSKMVWLVLPLALVFGLLTLQRNQVWKDNLSLFSHDLPWLEDCARCHYYYASALERDADAKQGSPAQYQEVIDSYNQSIAVSPRAYYSYIKLGNLYLRAGKAAEAERIFKSAKQEFPEAHGPLMYLAISLQRQGRDVEAISLLQKAGQIAPQNPETWYHLGRSFYNTGALKNALEVLNKGKKVDPQFAYYYDVEGDIYWDLGQQTTAFTAMKKALELEKGQAGLYNKIIGRSIQAGMQSQADRYKQMARDNGLGVK